MGYSPPIVLDLRAYPELGMLTVYFFYAAPHQVFGYDSSTVTTDRGGEGEQGV